MDLDRLTPTEARRFWNSEWLYPEHAVGPLEVELTAEDEEYAVHVRDERQANSRAAGWRNRQTGVLGVLKTEHVGAQAEVAVCRAWSLPLEEIRTGVDRHDPDVGGVDVRGTVHARGGLLFQASDHATRAYVLVLVLGDRRYRIPGWAWGWEGIRAEFWAPELPVPCYRFPQSRLHDPAWLPIRRGKT